jgi:hypothetical protein
MKMTNEHYNRLKTRMSNFKPFIEKHRENIIKENKAQDIDKRLRWDIFYASKMHEIYSYQEFDYTDNHIDTALKKIMKEIQDEN